MRDSFKSSGSGVVHPEMIVETMLSLNLDCQQLGRNPGPSFLGQVVCRNAILDVAELGPAMLFRGATPQDHYTIIFVAKCPAPGRAFNFGIEHRDGMIGFFPPGGQIEAYTPAGYANATLSVPTQEFEKLVALMAPEIPDAIMKHGCAARVGAAEEKRLRALLGEVGELLHGDAEPVAAQAVWCRRMRELAAAFIAGLRSGCDGRHPRASLQLDRRYRRLRQAREFIEERRREAIRIDRLCAELEMSERGVQKLFRDLLDIDPSSFLRQQRLHGVRRDLLDKDAEPGVVKETAMDWGFGHLGRFSADYRDLFGEFPRETLTR